MCVRGKTCVCQLSTWTCVCEFCSLLQKGTNKFLYISFYFSIFWTWSSVLFLNTILTSFKSVPYMAVTYDKRTIHHRNKYALYMYVCMCIYTENMQKYIHNPHMVTFKHPQRGTHCKTCVKYGKVFYIMQRNSWNANRIKSKEK